MTKFKSQVLHITRIKHQKASGSGNPPSLIPTLQKIAILGLKTKFSILFCTRLQYTVFARLREMGNANIKLKENVFHGTIKSNSYDQVKNCFMSFLKNDKNLLNQIKKTNYVHII